MADMVIEPAGSDYDIDEDDRYHNESMAGGAVEDEKPYLRFVSNLPNVTKEVGDSLRLRCEVDGTLPIEFRWFANDAPVVQKKKGRVVVKNLETVSRLRISGLQVFDSAYYRCEASNKFGKISTTGVAKVSGLSSPNRNNGQMDYNGQERPPFDLVDGILIANTCQIYNGRSCSQYLAGSRVYVTTNVISDLVYNERQIWATIKTINNLTKVSEPCRLFAEKAICFHKYELCDDKNERKHICRRHCDLLENDLCQDEYKWARDTDLIGNGMDQVLPDCKQLPQPQHVSDCVPILDHVDEPEGTHLCYTGNGNTYRGVVSETENGNDCKRWSEARHKFPQYKSTTYRELTDNNFCRNPGGEKPRPWCFTLDDKEEYCKINKCPIGLYPELSPNEKQPNSPVDVKNSSGGGAGDNDQSSSKDTGVLGIPMQYVFMAAGIVAVLLIAILILAVYKCIKTKKEKKKKIAANGHCANGVRKPQQCIQTPEHQELMQLIGQRAPYVPSNELLSEYPLSSVRFLEPLGEGQFGHVWKGELLPYSQDEDPISVALKMLKEDASPRQKKDFEQETSIICRLRHPNIVQLIGICKTAQTQCMIFEYMMHGDLHEFLLLRSPYSQMENVDNERILLDHGDFLHIATQIASGMEYLAAHHYVHRDLAARNCLVTDRLIIKISDFGLTRDVYSSDYYMCQSKKFLPIRWMPPEATLYGKYNELTDVWSFGVTLWEMYSYGTQPYYSFSNAEVLDMVRQRCLLECPENCPPRMYSLMVECWQETPNRRPRFAELHGRLQTWSVVSSPAHSAVNAASVAAANGALRSGSVMSGHSSGHISSSTAVGGQQQSSAVSGMIGNGGVHHQQSNNSMMGNNAPSSIVAVRNSPYGRSNNNVLPSGISPNMARMNGNVAQASTAVGVGGVYNVPRNAYGYSDANIDSASSVS